MALFFPQGPINSGDKAVMGYWDGKLLYVLTDASKFPVNKFSSDYVFQQAVVEKGDKNKTISIPSDIQISLIVFDIQGTQSQFVAAEVYPGTSYLGVTTSDDNSYFNRNPNVTTNFQAVQNIYADWGDPTLFLAGVQYQITKAGQTTHIKSYVVTSPSTVELRDIQPFFIPVVYFSKCTTSGEPFNFGSTCQQFTDSNSAILDGYCGLTNQTGKDICKDTPGPVWTTIQDALDNHPYQYCPKSQPICGTTCKAPCGNGYDYCQWTGVQFECKFSPNTLFSGNWWTKPWFIGLVILFVIFIFILIVVITSKK